MNKPLIIATVALATMPYRAEEPNTPSEADVEITTSSVIEETVDWDHDAKGSRSRVGMSGTKIPGKTTALKSTTEIKQRIKLTPRVHKVTCESDIDIEYYQKNTIAEVRTEISSANCDDFVADYQLRILYFDANGKLQRIVADENWPQGHAGQHTTSYSIEPGSELQRVASRTVSCTCTGDVTQ